MRLAGRLRSGSTMDRRCVARSSASAFRSLPMSGLAATGAIITSTGQAETISIFRLPGKPVSDCKDRSKPYSNCCPRARLALLTMRKSALGSSWPLARPSFMRLRFRKRTRADTNQRIATAATQVSDRISSAAFMSQQ